MANHARAVRVTAPPRPLASWPARAPGPSHARAHARPALAVALAIALAGCWRGPVSEPVETQPAPPPRTAHRAKRTALTGPSITSFSPGPLAMVHDAWDQPEGCRVCHVSVGQTAPLANTRCLGCHDHAELGARIATGVGLHASPRVARRMCQSCHREHRGRSFDLRGWSSLPGGEAGFDHALAGWALPAPYQGVPCASCHATVDSQGLRIYQGLDRGQFP